ncbi:hypothetical protein CB1_001241011 [Camelus ferus]|nr:hypothetical protein CB1_001241011 [Camelus ferus]
MQVYKGLSKSQKPGHENGDARVPNCSKGNHECCKLSVRLVPQAALQPPGHPETMMQCPTLIPYRMLLLLRTQQPSPKGPLPSSLSPNPLELVSQHKPLGGEPRSPGLPPSSFYGGDAFSLARRMAPAAKPKGTGNPLCPGVLTGVLRPEVSISGTISGFPQGQLWFDLSYRKCP